MPSGRVYLELGVQGAWLFVRDDRDQGDRVEDVDGERE